MSIFDRFTKKEKSDLNIIIVGCGKVGTTLMQRLSEEGHNITIIDTDPKIVENLSNSYDVMGVTGNGASCMVQMEAGIEIADLFIAVTESDELNLLCCTIAKKVGDCSTIARVRNPVYSEEQAYLREQLGLSMIINPELETARKISRILRLPAALSTSSFSKGQADLIRFQIPKDSYLDGKSLFSLQKEFDFKFLVCGLERGDSIIIPNGDQRLQAGDIITIVASARNAYVFFKKTDLMKRRVSDVIIVGGSKTAYYLAKQLTEMGILVKIIESDIKRCEELDGLLEKALIINGDGTNESLLMREGIESVDAFIPLTGIDEENILLTLYAKRITDAKVVTKVDRTNFNNVIQSLELGSIIHPRQLTAESITAYVRGKKNSIGSDNIESLYHWFDNRAEAVEFKIKKSSEITEVPLSEMQLKDNLLIASIIRNGKLIIPRGQDYILQGDTVVVVTTHTGLKNIHDILK